MPAVARAGDTVMSSSGTGRQCAAPMKTSVGEVNSKVKADGIFVVCEGKMIAPHPKRGCSPDTSTLSSFSSKVRVQGKGVGRIGDGYDAGPETNVISKGSSKVFAGG